MDNGILCELVAKQIDPAKFQVRGEQVVFLSEADNTSGNQSIIQSIVTNYTSLAASHTLEKAWGSVRVKRNNLLLESDWTRLDDSPITVEKKAEWATYRQALRDLPETYASDINAIVWPTKPS